MTILFLDFSINNLQRQIFASHMIFGFFPIFFWDRKPQGLASAVFAFFISLLSLSISLVMALLCSSASNSDPLVPDPK